MFTTKSRSFCSTSSVEELKPAERFEVRLLAKTTLIRILVSIVQIGWYGARGVLDVVNGQSRLENKLPKREGQTQRLSANIRVPQDKRNIHGEQSSSHSERCPASFRRVLAPEERRFFFLVAERRPNQQQ